MVFFFFFVMKEMGSEAQFIGEELQLHFEKDDGQMDERISRQQLENNRVTCAR